MNEDLRLKISQFMDNELDQKEALKFLELVNEHPELENTIKRFEIIRKVAKAEVPIEAGSDFVSRVSMAIKQEPTVMAPNARRVNKGYQTTAAIAASVAVFSVILMGGYRLSSSDFHSSLLAIRNTETNKPIQLAEKTPEKEKPVDNRFNEYLEAHDDSLYAAGSSGFQSYARVVSYGRQ
ncbi:MAG: sigma-E factor negative regulatory protein [Gammaproteobacteria bacterium]